ncbi:hypothetical protein [Streptomyces sp. NPDC093109]|uniref:hypothetical protein n=1 Tax=Streptomyces sp. NPDC093109 TaxID=3154977 RepID=UPI00344D2B24
MEWIKFWSLRSSFATLSVAALVTVALGLVSSLVVEGDGGSGPALRDPTWNSLYGVTMAALATAVVGVLMATGEYATGTIRSTLSAVPARLPVLWAKAAVFTAGSFAFTFAASMVSFLAGQAILASRGLDGASLADPGAFRAVIGAAVYLTGAGLVGLAAGWSDWRRAACCATRRARSPRWSACCSWCRACCGCCPGASATPSSRICR